MFWIKLAMIFGIVGISVGLIQLAKEAIQKVILEAKAWKMETATKLAKKNMYEIDTKVGYVECKDFSGTPSQVISYIANRLGIPEEMIILIIAAESSADPYAVSCDICRSCGGLTSDRWKTNPKTQEWIGWIIENEWKLSSHMSRGGKNIDCSKPSYCWCNVGFGLTQVASFNLSFSPSVPPNPPLIEEEPPESPFNVCTNIYEGMKVLKKCIERYGNSAKALCCYNGRNNEWYLEYLKRKAEELGIERKWYVRLFDFTQETWWKIKNFFFSLIGKDETC
ncbi:MAG: hypothetical protein DSY42_03025 [Aquifex sp.]|nr:MAG: hypothetical protein DSY42_03025 [Aquifex sp.]